MKGRIGNAEPLFTEEEAERAKEELVLEANLTRGFTSTGPNKSETGTLIEPDSIKREKIEEMIEKTIKSMGFVMPNSTLLEEDGGSVLEALEELRAKVNSLSNRSETLEAGEKLSTLYWLKQMTEINSISKDIEELRTLKEKVEPLGKPLPSENIEELRKKVESLSSKSETLEAGEKLGILNKLKQIVKTKPRRVEVSKPALSEDKISSILKDSEESKKLKDKEESLPSEEKKEIGGRIIEEEII